MKNMFHIMKLVGDRKIVLLSERMNITTEMDTEIINIRELTWERRVAL
jgi:hypothetical protein